MEYSVLPPATPTESQIFSSAHLPLVQRFWRDPLLLSGFLVFGLMVGFQLAIHLAQPPWIGEVNDWLLIVLAGLEVLVLLGVSWWFSHTHRPGALIWWLLSVALLCYMIRRIFVLADDPALVLLLPFPRWSHLFALLQFFCLFLAVLLLPTTSPHAQWGLSRLRVFLDSLLLMSAVMLLSWYSLLLPLYLQPGSSLAARATNLTYGIAGLGLLFILIVLLVRERRPQLDRLVLGLLSLAFFLLMVGNFWLATLDLQNRRASGEPPDAFWILGYMLIPLAGLVQARLVRWGAGPRVAVQRVGRVQWQDLLDCLRFMLPFVLALLASIINTLEAFLAPKIFGSPIPVLIVSAGLLTLMVARQGVLFLEQVRLRREQAAAQVRELALAETNQQMEAFVTMASHELKTPLTVMTLHLQQARRRFQRVRPQEVGCPPEVVQVWHRCEQDLVGAEAQLKRQGRLVNELLDVSRIQVGRLDLHLEPGELQAIVQAAVEEQRETWPERSIQLQQPSERAVPIEADSDRIGQVVTNYLTNALRYSAEDRPVEVGVHAEGQQGVVWVRDQGPGLPPAESGRIWERFYRASGIAIQSGSGVGLGIGLYLCKTIVEQHQGQVGMQSAPGEGSTFWFKLPLCQSARD